jgi:hypothetical protein
MSPLLRLVRIADVDHDGAEKKDDRRVAHSCNAFMNANNSGADAGVAVVGSGLFRVNGLEGRLQLGGSRRAQHARLFAAGQGWAATIVPSRHTGALARLWRRLLTAAGDCITC